MLNCSGDSVVGSIPLPVSSSIAVCRRRSASAGGTFKNPVKLVLSTALLGWAWANDWAWGVFWLSPSPPTLAPEALPVFLRFLLRSPFSPSTGGGRFAFGVRFFRLLSSPPVGGGLALGVFPLRLPSSPSTGRGRLALGVR